MKMEKLGDIPKFTYVELLLLRNSSPSRRESMLRCFSTMKEKDSKGPRFLPTFTPSLRIKTGNKGLQSIFIFKRWRTTPNSLDCLISSNPVQPKASLLKSPAILPTRRNLNPIRESWETLLPKTESSYLRIPVINLLQVRLLLQLRPIPKLALFLSKQPLTFRGWSSTLRIKRRRRWS